MFVDADNNDFHLWYSSPCINAGDPNYSCINEPEPNGGRIDMGVYGNTAEATSIRDVDNDSLSDNWEMENGLDPNDANDAIADLDGDGLRNIDEYRIRWNPNSDDSTSIFGLVHNEAQDINYPTISIAMSHVEDRDRLIVPQGHYFERVNYSNKRITIRGTDPNDPCVISNTIIDANNRSSGVSVVSFGASEGPNSVLEGLTITGGYYGISCGTTAPRILNNRITNNSSSGLYCGSSGSAPSVYHCTFSNNGSGASCYGDMILQNCLIVNNSSWGVRLLGGSSAGSNIINCTIVGNGGGISTYAGCEKITNCIIWDNGDDLDNCSATYSCIQDMDLGVGVINLDPMFVDADNNDFHLWYSSPCINAGDPNYSCINEPEPNGGRIDMGVYGNTAEATFMADEDQDGIPDGWELHYWPNDDPNQHDPNDNPDNDDFTNWIEYLFRYDPATVTDVNMDVYYNGGLPSQINPLDGEETTIEYWTNKDANEVKTTIADATSGTVVREIIETTVSAGINHVTWDGTGIDSNIVEPNCFDVTITAKAESDPCDTDTWTTSGGSVTAPSTNDSGTVYLSNFDPYKNIPVRLYFNISEWGKMELRVDPTQGSGYIAYIFVDKLLHPGGHNYYWYGRDKDGQIYNGEFKFYFGAPEGVKISGIIVDYTPAEVNDFVCNQYRIIPTYREVATIAYNLTRNAIVSMNIIDPDGSHFRTLLDNSVQSPGPNEVIWDGTDDDGQFVFKEGVYDIEVITKDPNRPEVGSERIGAVTVFR
jgi:parallel beta-helix repeat protein